MTDIVARLREETDNWKVGPCVTEAADEIERLRAELAAERERNAAPSEYDLALLAERDAMADNAAKMNDAASRYLRRAEQAERERDALRAQLAEAGEALGEAETVMSWMLLEGVDEVIHETCPKEYERFVFAHAWVAALMEKIKGGGDE